MVLSLINPGTLGCSPGTYPCKRRRWGRTKDVTRSFESARVVIFDEGTFLCAMVGGFGTVESGLLQSDRGRTSVGIEAFRGGKLLDRA